MPLAHAQQIINAVQEGTHKATVAERRLCVQYLLATQPDITSHAMGDIFGVSERMIRIDKAWIRKQKAHFLKEEMTKDLALVIADIAMDFEKQVADIEKSKKQAKPGSKAYVDHCNSVFEMRMKMVKAFQDIGFLPKHLGNMTVDKFDYKAVVNKDGTSVTRPVDMQFESAPEEPLVIEMEPEPEPEPNALPPAIIEKDEEQETLSDHSKYCLVVMRPGTFACTCGFTNATNSKGNTIPSAVGSNEGSGEENSGQAGIATGTS